MFADGAVAAVLAWLGTFAVHSTLALAAAWLTSVALQQRALVFQERLLRFSLWAAVATCSVQVLVVGSPVCFVLPDVDVAPAWLGEQRAPELPAVAGPVETSPDAVSAAAPAATPLSVASVIVAAAGLLMVCGAVWFVRLHLRFFAVLRGRVPEREGRVLAAAADAAGRLGLRQTPRLSRSDRIATPIAFGWLRPEICLPVRASELADASLQAMLAHEVAHLRRRDPAWMWLAAAMQAAFPWQPLFVLVRRRWARLVELRCDAIAAAHSSPTAVARCLLDVADWLRPQTAVPQVALGMAARPSALRERIEAALHAQASGGSNRLGSAAFGSGLLSLLAWLGPSVQIAGRPAAADPIPPAADAPEAAAADPLRAAAQVLDEEYQAVAAEAARLRAELAARGKQELEAVVRQLSERLLTVERLRMRLREMLDRRDVLNPRK